MSRDDKDTIIENQRLEIERLRGQVKYYTGVNRTLENDLSAEKVAKNYYKNLYDNKKLELNNE